MTAVEIDYEATARRGFDVPLDDDARAALRVWGDILEGQGDPRGGLIAIEHAGALLGGVHARTETTNGYVTQHAAALLGGFTPALAVPRAVVLDWRAGALYGAFVDQRKVWQLWPAGNLEGLLRSPAARTLRRLHVRVRYEYQFAVARCKADVIKLIVSIQGHTDQPAAAYAVELAESDTLDATLQGTHRDCRRRCILCNRIDYNFSRGFHDGGSR